MRKTTGCNSVTKMHNMSYTICCIPYSLSLSILIFLTLVLLCGRYTEHLLGVCFLFETRNGKSQAHIQPVICAGLLLWGNFRIDENLEGIGFEGESGVCRCTIWCLPFSALWQSLGVNWWVYKYFSLVSPILVPDWRLICGSCGFCSKSTSYSFCCLCLKNSCFCKSHRNLWYDEGKFVVCRLQLWTNAKMV